MTAKDGKQYQVKDFR